MYSFSYSVVIPVYNNESIICELLKRIDKISENCQDIIIVDDCSRDNTKSLIQEYIDQNTISNSIRIFSNQINQGPAYSRNVGMKMSKMDYVAFLDSDDDWHPKKIECQIFLMKKYGAFVAGTLHKVVSKTELKVLSTSGVNFDEIDVKLIGWPFVLFKSPFSTPSVVIKNGLDMNFDETLRYSEDYNFWIRLSKKYKVIRIEQALTYTFKHDYLSNTGSLSSDLFAMQKGEFSNFSRLFRTESLTLKDRMFVMLAIFFSCLKFFRRLVLKLLH